MTAKADPVRVVTLSEVDLEALLERAAEAGAARVRPPAEVLTADDAAELLRLHPKTVRQMANAGELPAHPFGREWRFLRSELLAHIAGKVA